MAESVRVSDCLSGGGGGEGSYLLCLPAADVRRVEGLDLNTLLIGGPQPGVLLLRPAALLLPAAPVRLTTLVMSPPIKLLRDLNNKKTPLTVLVEQKAVDSDSLFRVSTSADTNEHSDSLPLQDTPAAVRILHGDAGAAVRTQVAGLHRNLTDLQTHTRAFIVKELLM